MIDGVRESGTVWNESWQASWGREPWTVCHLVTILCLLFPFSLIPGGQGGATHFFSPKQETKIQNQKRMKTRPPCSPPQSSNRGEGGGCQFPSLQLHASPSGCSPASRPEEPTVRSGGGVSSVTGQAAAGHLSLSL